jgi:urease gamma subunit
MHSVSFCTSLMQVGAFILVMAEIFSGLASMLRWLMMKPSSFPEGTPKTHLLELSFH